jgi:hypothetical protein
VLLSDGGIRIWQVDTGRDLVWQPEVEPAVKDYLAERAHAGKPGDRGLKRLGKYIFSAWAKKKGFEDYMYRNWLRGLRDDNRLTITTRAEKRWAHRRGFYSYRIKQYGLTEENYRDVLSDYSYKRLRPINGHYQKWLWDKVFMYYVMTPYKNYLPRHYYRIVPVEGKNRIYSFDPDQPGEATVYDVIDLLRREKLLVCKPAVGSHGKGFARLEWQDESVIVNGERMDRQGFSSYLNAMDKTFFLSEFVEMHSDLRRIYDGVVNTVRIMTIDIDGRPRVESAYFRIGSRSTGNTDNLDTGGLVARVDVPTGRFGSAEMLIGHAYQPRDVHPDTGAALTGALPHWEEIKNVVAEIAAYLYPLEYLGFDIVITQDGFRILEINTHQDLHRYPEYPQEVKEYFQRKCALKGRADHV